jgi:hypothetical protein
MVLGSAIRRNYRRRDARIRCFGICANLGNLASILSEEYAIIDGVFLTPWQLAVQLVQNQPALAEKARIVETYPDGMVVEVTPLSIT